eukprot:TRINITY_DN8883_c0_g1_i1.p1 TRINITY_DN8883_c0_g1~~TRINITY_DN8883_c0_g1_i1.p1  ORF type:complete len:826 (+),score=339.12 TRINITY_DN8883_c0_g1_i1:203-2680(+)
MRQALCLALVLSGVSLVSSQTSYVIDDSKGPARTYDGIGGLSGGGATSVLLPYYQEPYRSQILDFLFLPNFGANLHILKVEIGGDAQSTDGAESSHMHNPWEENYQRGYEWWLINEAKKRNPDIKIYGLPWAWPQWVTCNPGTMTNCTNDPYSRPDQSATYVTKWVSGALNTYGIEVDYIGIWNERNYDDTYIKTLRSTLDTNGFQNTKIVAPDGSWDIANDILNDPGMANAVHALGAHYPGMYSTSQAEKTGKPLWASEDDSTFNNAVGAGCWARIINRNYVLGNMTATINWNLIASYMKGTNWYRAGLMTALQPWAGSYTVSPTIWVSAHTTQFTQPGWSYLATGSGAGTGSGVLQNGGSYVTIENFETGDFTIVIEKMSRDNSPCTRPDLAPYDTSNELATFKLVGAPAKAQQLQLFYTHLAFGVGDTEVTFEKQTPIAVVDGSFTLNITVDSIYTISTITTASKGSFAEPPAPAVFPPYWADDYELYPISSEAAYWADQNGVWEIYPSGDPKHGNVMRQMVPTRPVTWGGDIRPHSLLGSRDTVNASFSTDAYIEEPGAGLILGVRMQGTDDSSGIIWAIDSDGNWNITTSIIAVDQPGLAIASGTTPVPIGAGVWHTYRFDVNGTKANGWIDGQYAFAQLDISKFDTSGHVAMGTIEYGQYTQFDNLVFYSTQTVCGGTPPVAGAPISIVQCSSEVGPKPGSSFDFIPSASDAKTGAFRLRANASLCVGMESASRGQPAWLQLSVCNAADVNQQWTLNYQQLYQSSIVNTPSGRCLDVYNQNPEIGAAADAWPCNGQQFVYDYDPGEIVSIPDSICLGVC